MIRKKKIALRSLTFNIGLTSNVPHNFILIFFELSFSQSIDFTLQSRLPVNEQLTAQVGTGLCSCSWTDSCVITTYIKKIL